MARGFRWLGMATVSTFMVFLPSAARAQAERSEVPKHQDPVIQGVQDHIDRLCESHDARLAKIDGPETLTRELTRARARFLSLLDLDLDTPRRPPAVTPAGVLDFPEYRVEKLIIEAAPGVPVPCNLYVPKSGPTRKPTLLSPHGHSGRDRPIYQNAYQRFAKAGFIVLAKDGWGKQERRGTGHGEAGGQLALTGTELLALEVFDNIRCLDYLLTRPDVDGERLGMAGISGGGSQTLYTMAVEPRLKAASPTCAVTTFRADLADTTMCVCELAHDILTVGDHGLFLAMAYPRPLLVVNGTRDPIFPVAGARSAFAQAKRLYAADGREEAVEFAEFDAPHEWTDAMIDRQIGWFRRQFGLTELASLPPGDGPRDADLFGCYADGDLPEGSLTLSDLNRSRLRSAGAGSDTAARGRMLEADRERLASTIRRRWSGEPSLPSRIERRDLGPDPRSGGPRERLSWTSGLGGDVTAVVTRPAGGDEVGQVVIHLEDRDRPEPQLERLYWDDRVKDHAVLVTLAYTGAALDANREGQLGSALTASGRSLLAERARDLSVALLVLRDRGFVTDQRRVSLVAHGFDGVLLLASAPLLPPGVCLVLDRTSLSYIAGAETDFATCRLIAPPYHWSILPGLGNDHDLVELLDLAHPRRVLLTHPLDAAQRTLGLNELAVLLGQLTRTDRSHVEAMTCERTRAEVHRRITELVTASP
ncbi:prolyl oligopeptidase family serine peptidase [Isosphaeraceae bacterium EP7]